MSELNQDIKVVWRTNPYTGEYTWTYGNWGGKGWSAGQFTPPGQEPDWRLSGLSDLDRIFRIHDKAYQDLQNAWAASAKSQQDIASYWKSTIAADVQMRQGIHDLGVNNEWGSYPPGGDVPDVDMANAAIQADRLFALKALRDLENFKNLKNPDTGKSENSESSGGDSHSGLPWPGGGNGDGNGDGADRWTDAENTTSPLILDLNGDGVKTLNKTAGKHFDHAGDGFAERTGWVDKDDGLLVRDLNGDGKITSGRELFGNRTRLSQGANAGKQAAHSFEALAELDDNSDGVVDAKDAAFASLRVWKDTNANGLTDAGELLSLAQAGVKSLKVGYTDESETASANAQGNIHRQLGEFTTTGGATRSMDDVWFATRNWDTVDLRMPLALTSDIEALPEIEGSGPLLIACPQSHPNHSPCQPHP